MRERDRIKRNKQLFNNVCDQLNFSVLIYDQGGNRKESSYQNDFIQWISHAIT